MSEPIIEKHCRACNQAKTLNLFFKNRAQAGGYDYYCKVCRNIVNETYRHTKKGQISQRKYRQSIARKVTVKRYITTHRQEINARAIINYRVVSGIMPRPDTLGCAHCGQPAEEYHHHKGYGPEHRFDVIAICVQCHNI